MDLEKTEQTEAELAAEDTRTRAAEAAHTILQSLYPPPNERASAEVHEDTKTIFKALAEIDDLPAKKLILRLIADDDGILSDLIVATTLNRLSDEVAILKEELKRHHDGPNR